MSDTTNKVPAVIILRHGCDGGHSDPYKITFKDTVTISYSGKYKNIDGQTVVINNDRLGGLGQRQACALGFNLPSFLNEKYAPVSRIITENPGDGINGTANPLNTIIPYINAVTNLHGSQLKLDLHDNADFDKIKDVFKASTILKDGENYSTIISWEAWTMWRNSDGEYQEKSILGTLVKDDQNPMLNNDDLSPRKGQTIYIFTGLNTDTERFDTLEIYDFNPYTKAFKLLTTTDWPDKLCSKAQQH